MPRTKRSISPRGVGLTTIEYHSFKTTVWVRKKTHFMATNGEQVFFGAHALLNHRKTPVFCPIVIFVAVPLNTCSDWNPPPDTLQNIITDAYETTVPILPSCN